MPLSRVISTGIQDGTIVTTDLADNAVNSAKIGVDVIVADDLAANSVTVSEITDGAVTGAKLANNLNYDSGTLYLDSTNNRVGVGTTTPTHPLTVNGQIKSIGANGETIQLQTSSQYSGVSFVGSDGTRDAIIDYDHTTGIMGLKAHTSGHAINFATGGYTERMRINSSGDLLVGKTSVDYTTVGFEATPSSTFQANAMTADGKKALLLARKTSDGEIVQFRKDTTSVGSIGVNTDRLFIGDSSFGGIAFPSGGSGVLPAGGSGALNDNTHDLGNSSTRFKDLYLSGGAYIGGTGSANYLDDFEEGTWTPTFVASGCTFTHSIQKGYYTKIGRLVIYHCYLQLDGSLSTNGNAVIIDGLPYTSLSTHGNVSTSVAGIRYVNLSSNYYTVEGRINNNNNYITLYESGDNQATAVLPANRLSNSSGQVQLSGHFITTS